LQALSLAAVAWPPGPPPSASPEVATCTHVYGKFVLELGPFVLRTSEGRLLGLCDTARCYFFGFEWLGPGLHPLHVPAC